MKFLVYTVTSLDDNTTLDGFEKGVDKDLAWAVNRLETMNLERVMENETISLLVDNVNYKKSTGTVTADIYKQANPRSALHQFEQEGGEVTIQEILSEQEEAFVKGLVGMKKVDGELQAVVEKDFGSYFSAASKGFDIVPHFSAEAIQSIQDSATIGKTELDFEDDYDLTASLFKPPEDGDIRQEDGFGNVDVMNKLMSVMRISRSHRITLDINRHEWLDNVEMFEELIQSDLISTIRIKGTKDGTVKIGKGRNRAIRETVETSATGKASVSEAFAKLTE
ncbi:hypothetical protein AB7C87_17015 [Natrarchaeobius sp. A-rgal3]|uniref:hypothetical protein n=1 Tax=Natrarchaeobius versutus TaxID=1679078 RepID=UPI00350FF8D7